VQNATPKTLFQLMQVCARARGCRRALAHNRLCGRTRSGPDPIDQCPDASPARPLRALFVPPSARSRAAWARGDDVGPHQEPPAEVPRQHQGGPRHVPKGLRAHAPRGREPLPRGPQAQRPAGRARAVQRLPAFHAAGRPGRPSAGRRARREHLRHVPPVRAALRARRWSARR
jgi:hypothetical protein